MNLIFVAAFIAACQAAKLDRTYLPPLSSQTAGGSPGSLQPPLITRFNSANPGFSQPSFTRTSDTYPSQGNIPSGSYENENEAVVVDAAAPGTRASNQPSGLGGARDNYGSTDSKVGDAAFRGTKNQAQANTNDNKEFQAQSQFGTFQQGAVGVNNINNPDYPDLSAFYQPSGQINTGFRPGNQISNDQVSNTIKYHNDIGVNKFNYGFETENGIKMEQNGVSNNGVQAEGGYSYTGDDGKVYSIVYTADKDGYKPVGAHLPTPPPIPAEILESLKQNAKDEANGLNDDGTYDAQKYNAEDDYAQSNTNGNYNDRQSNKFGDRPESDAGATSINQHQQGFVRPNVQGQSNYYVSKDTSTQIDTTKYGGATSTFDKTSYQGHSGTKNDFNTQFGSQFQYLPPFANIQGSKPALEVDSSKAKGNVQPFAVQNLQGHGSFSTSKNPSSFGTSVSDQGFNKQETPSKQSINSFGTDITSQNAQVQTIQSSSVGTNMGFAIGNVINSPVKYDPTSLPISVPNIGISFSQENLSNSSQKQESYTQVNSQTSFGSEINKTLSSGLNNRFASSVTSQALPTKQPALTLTTPFENQEQQTHIVSDINTPIDFQTINSNYFNIEKPQSSQSFLYSNRKPSNSQFNNNFVGQSQGFYDSYIYNNPSKLFNSHSNEPPSIPLNSVTQPDGSIYSTKYQAITGSTNYPQFLDSVAPTLATTNEEDADLKNTFKANGITQASVSRFPSISPTSPSQTQSGKVYEYNKPAQSSQAVNISESNSELIQGNTFSSIPKEDSVKHKGYSQSNTQFGQQYLPPTTPTTSSFGQEPFKSQFGAQGSVSTGQNPNLLALGQKDSPFGQRPTQQQTSFTFGQQNTPSGFDDQQGFSFGTQTTPSQYNTQTILTAGQQTTPFPFGGSSFATSSNFGSQTGSSFEQNPTQSQGGQPNFSFEQQTTPSPFGVPSSSSFGSSFGVQTSSIFGQTPGQIQKGGHASFPFGSQSTPSPFSAQSQSFAQIPTFGISFNQKPMMFDGQTQLGALNSFSFGSQPTPSRFGVQTGSIFGQQTTTSQFGSQTSTSSGKLTTPAKFDYSLSAQQSRPQFGAGPNKQQIENNAETDQFNRFSESGEEDTETDSKPSSLQPATSELESSNESIETDSDEIYEYNKPTGLAANAQSSLTSNKQTHGTQYHQQLNTQFDEQSFSIPSRNEDASQTNPQSLEGQSVTNTPFASQSTTSVAPVKEQGYETKETNAQFSSNSQSSFPQYQPPAVPSFNVENTQSDEIYQYNKPSQSFAGTSENTQENNLFGQKITQQSTQNKLDLAKPIVSHISQGNEKYVNAQLSTLKPNVQTQSDTSNKAVTDILTSSKLTEPRPQLSFYSACAICQGIKTQNNQKLQSFSGKIPSDTSPETSATNIGGISTGSGLKNKFGNQGSGSAEEEIQRDTPSFVVKGEKFDGPRKPPKYDQTGYHY